MIPTQRYPGPPRRRSPLLDIPWWVYVILVMFFWAFVDDCISGPARREAQAKEQAETERRQQAERTEREAKRAYDQKVEAEAQKLVDSYLAQYPHYPVNLRGVMVYGYESRLVTGYLDNVSPSNLSMVYIEFDVYDAAGSKIGMANDIINGLRPGETWQFKASYYGAEGTTFRLHEIRTR